MSDSTEHERRPDGRPRSTVGRLVERLSLTPGRVAAVYLVIGFVALLFSDVLLVELYSDPRLQRLQFLKGAVEVVATGGLIYGLTWASRASLRRRTTETERHRKELRLLHRILRHDLRNQLTVLRGQTTHLRDRLTQPDREDACESILETVEDIVQFTEQAQEIRKLTADRAVTRIDLASLVPRVLADHEHLGAGVTVTSDLPETAEVLASEQFGKALEELVENAVVHDDDTETDVSIRVDRTAGPPGTTTVTVEDDGPGIPAYVERVLADGERDELVHLDGLGLWFAYLTVIESGGEFAIDSREGEGTTIRMRLPTAGAGLVPSVTGSAVPTKAQTD